MLERLMAIAMLLSIFGCTQFEDDSSSLSPQNSRDTIQERNSTSASRTMTFPTLEQDWFSFDSEDAFETFVNGTTPVEVTNFIETQTSFTSMNYGEWAMRIDPEAPEEVAKVFSLFNENSLLKIDDYFFKIDNATESLFVIESSVSSEIFNQYKMAESTEAYPSETLFFGFDDDVFAYFEDINRSNSRANCASGNKDKEKIKDYCRTIEGTTFQYKILVKYVTIGIWKWLRMEFHHKCKSGCNDGTDGGIGDNVDFDIRYNGAWIPRNRTLQNARRDFTYCNNFICPTPEHGKKWTKTFYSGTRCLSAYILEGQAAIKSACTGRYEETVTVRIPI